MCVFSYFLCRAAYSIIMRNNRSDRPADDNAPNDAVSLGTSRGLTVAPPLGGNLAFEVSQSALVLGSQVGGQPLKLRDCRAPFLGLRLRGLPALYSLAHSGRAQIKPCRRSLPAALDSLATCRDFRQVQFSVRVVARLRSRAIALGA